MAADKDTIYIDIDDEITSIVDKVHSSPHKIVALVLPKRATMLQSSVNMKLLKRAADSSKKHIVLITSEAGLMPLAAAAGMHVAKTLQTKPEIPEVGDGDEIATDEEKIEDHEPEPAANDESDFDPKEAANKSIGSLAGVAALDREEETIELDNSDKEDEKPVATKKARKQKANKALRVPNFERFRKWLIIGVVVFIALIVGWIYAATQLPKATVTVDTDTSTVSTSLALNLDSTATALDPTKLIVPAKAQSTQKTSTQQVPATGQKNEGTPATGTVTLALTDCSQVSETIPAGTGLSTNGLTFITQSTATLGSITVKGKCSNDSLPGISSASVNVISQQPGSQYNVGASTFTVAGFSNVQGTSSSAMTGGTDNIITIVTQNDIDNAKQKLATQDSSTIKTQLQSALQSAGYYALPSTFNVGTPAITTSANVGDQVSNVTVTSTTTYTMFGVKQSDLDTLIDNNVKQQIDPTKQVILNDGLSSATYNVTSQTATAVQLTMTATATAGPQLDANSLKQQIAGKKSGEVKSIISANPGVTSVSVKYSPFWVDSTPKKASRVTINFVKTSQSDASGN